MLARYRAKWAGSGVFRRSEAHSIQTSSRRRSKRGQAGEHSCRPASATVDSPGSLKPPSPVVLATTAPSHRLHSKRALAGNQHGTTCFQIATMRRKRAALEGAASAVHGLRRAAGWCSCGSWRRRCCRGRCRGCRKPTTPSRPSLCHCRLCRGGARSCYRGTSHAIAPLVDVDRSPRAAHHADRLSRLWEPPCRQQRARLWTAGITTVRAALEVRGAQ
jgi:hypothetical protein